MAFPTNEIDSAGVIGLYVPGIAGPDCTRSDEACRLAGLVFETCESRTLSLKGRGAPVTVWVIRVTAG